MIYRLAIPGVLAICLASSEAVGRSNVDTPVQLRCAPFSQAGIPRAALQTDPEAIERFQLINREANSGPHMVVFLGDSLIQKWDRSVWERYFAPLGSLNAGVNGDRTEHLLWRIE